MDAAPRPPQAPRPVDTPWRQQRDKAVKALQHFGGTTLACEADARPALVIFERALQAPLLATSTGRALARAGTRGRPRLGAQPHQGRDQIDGAVASSRTARQARRDHQRCFILATHELAPAQLPPPAVLEGSTGQGHAERGCRFVQDPPVFASSLDLQKPERIMARLLVMTVCWLV